MGRIFETPPLGLFKRRRPRPGRVGAQEDVRADGRACLPAPRRDGQTRGGKSHAWRRQYDNRTPAIEIQYKLHSCGAPVKRPVASRRRLVPAPSQPQPPGTATASSVFDKAFTIPQNGDSPPPLPPPARLPVCSVRERRSTNHFCFSLIGMRCAAPPPLRLMCRVCWQQCFRGFLAARCWYGPAGPAGSARRGRSRAEKGKMVPPYSEIIDGSKSACPGAHGPGRGAQREKGKQIQITTSALHCVGRGRGTREKKGRRLLFPVIIRLTEMRIYSSRKPLSEAGLTFSPPACRCGGGGDGLTNFTLPSSPARGCGRCLGRGEPGAGASTTSESAPALTKGNQTSQAAGLQSTSVHLLVFP